MILVSRKLKRVDWPKYKYMVGNSENNELVLFSIKYKIEDFKLQIFNGIKLKLSKENKYHSV